MAELAAQILELRVAIRHLADVRFVFGRLDKLERGELALRQSSWMLDSVGHRSSRRADAGQTHVLESSRARNPLALAVLERL